MHSNFLADVPAFVWCFLVGTVICFLLGYFQLDDEAVNRGRKISDSDRYGSDLILMSAVGLGFMVVVVCLRYSVTIPKFFLWKIGLFGLAVVMIVVVCGAFCWVSQWGRTLSMNNIGKTEHCHRHHHHRMVR